MQKLTDDKGPYYVYRTPRGSIVACAAHILTEEIKDEEAEAIANTMNAEHQKRMRA